MLTSTDAIAARQFEVSLRDALDVAQVESFMDRLISTLLHYERSGQFQTNGITSTELASMQFRYASGQGYNRNAVERIRLSATEALSFYEKSLSHNATASRTQTRISRVKQQAPHASLAQAQVAVPAQPQPYSAPQNSFRPPTPAAANQQPGGTTALGFDVPVLEDTISVPIRRPQAAREVLSHTTESALFNPELAQIFEPEQRTPVQAPLAAPISQSGAFSGTSLNDTGVLDTGTQQASPVEYSAILSPVVFENYATTPKLISLPRLATPPAPAPAQPTNRPVQAPTVHRAVASPASAPSAPSPRTTASPRSAAIDPENPVALEANEFLAQLTQVLRTKEVLAQRNPQTHSATGSIKLNTAQGFLEVTAVRLHSNGQIYLETKKA